MFKLIFMGRALISNMGRTTITEDKQNYRSNYVTKFIKKTC